VYISTPLACCEERDPKKLYAKARVGEITGFTGIDAPYEPPLNPELTIDTTAFDVEAAARMVVNYLTDVGVLREPIGSTSC
jgi:adenylylsulfate kinase